MAAMSFCTGARGGGWLGRALGMAMAVVLVSLSGATPLGEAGEESLRSGLDAEAMVEELSPTSGASSVRGPVAVPATLIAQEGATPAGLNGPITSLNSPFTNGLGQVGFTGGANDGGAGTDNFVWFDTGIAFLDANELGSTLSGGESTMGVGNAGEFVYSPSVNGEDAVWTHNGLLNAEGQAPGFPAGTNSTFNSRPQMLPGGQAVWVAGFDDTGGTTTMGRVVYRSDNSTPGAIAVVLRSDDVVGGFTIDRPSGIDFDYGFSDDGLHHIHVLLMDTGSTANDDFVYVDGALVAREANPTGDGDNWDNFGSVSINNAGNHLFAGDTDGATTSDEFIAYNSMVAIREGDVLDGVTLTTPAAVRALSINNLGNAVHLWSIAGFDEVLFFACDASDLGASSVVLLATGDGVDLDGDTVADATVTDFNASGAIGPGLSLAENGVVYVEVALDPGAGELESVIRLTSPQCGDPAITVAPPSLDSAQAPDSVVSLPLTVSNVGTADLDFTVAEAPLDCAAPSDLPWVSALPLAGTVVPAGSSQVDVSFDSTGLAPQVLSGLLCITSNDPGAPVVSVPLTLTVLGDAAITVAPPALASDQAADTVVSLPLTVGNVGTADLDFTVAEAPLDCAAPSDLPWVSALPLAGIVAPAGNTPVDVSFDSTSLAPGVYTGLLCIASNDPANPIQSVQLTLTVLGGPSLLEVPTLSGAGLAVFVGVLALLGLWVLRRRSLV